MINKYRNIIGTAAIAAATLFCSSAQAQTYQSHDGTFAKPYNFVVGAGEAAPTSGFTWQYTFSEPAANWHQPSFNDSSWSRGRGSFNRGGTQPGDASTNITWPSDRTGLWARSTFVLPDSPQKNLLMFWGRWDDNIRIYINGVEAVSLFDPLKPHVSMWTGEYRYLGMSEEARNSLVAGTNRIAVHVGDLGGGAHLNLGIVKNYSMANLPVRGYTKNEHFDGIFEHIRKEMSRYGVPAGALSIGLDTGGDAEIVASAGMGYMNKSMTRAVPRDAVFRLASLDKPPARSAIRKMIADGTPDPSGQSANISLNTPMFPLLDALLRQSGVPGLTGAPDASVNTITIGEVLNQTSGISGGLTDQGSAMANVRWIYRQPLGSDRGGDPRYNNTAHVVLRYLVHRLAFANGFGDYNDYIRHELLEESDDKNMYIAWQDLGNRVHDSYGNLLEPWYVTGRFFWPGEGIRDVLGGASSADAYTKYLLEVSGTEPWNGSMPGSQTFSRKGSFRDSSGVLRRYAYTLMFNSGFPRDGRDIVNYVNSAIRSLPASAWTDSSCN